MRTVRSLLAIVAGMAAGWGTGLWAGGNSRPGTVVSLMAGALGLFVLACLPPRSGRL